MTVSAEPASQDIAGLLRDRIAGTRLYRDLGIALLDVADGAVSAAFDVDERHCNIDGILHGGLYALLADTAMGCAARTRQQADSENRTLRLDVDYHGSVHSGERLSAEARIVHVAGRLAWVEATLVALRGDERRPVGTARSLNTEASARR